MYWNEGDRKEHEQSHEDKIFQCEDCDKKFEKEDSFMNHKQIHKRSQTLACDKCEDKFTLKRELMEHIVITHTELNDTQCREPGKGVAEIEVFVDIIQSHKDDAAKVEYCCKKCDNIYFDMRKLRRHDWRNHRTIQCTICSEMLESRQDMTSHRQNKHKMFRKLPSRYFPDCYDGDECLFDHNIKEETNLSVCPNGQNCVDQSCSYSEQNHRSQRPNLCRFQEKCNRAGCLFKHMCVRNAFLGVSPSNTKRK